MAARISCGVRSTRLLRKRQPKGCPHLLRCGVSQMESAGGIYFRRGQTESFKAFMPMDTLHPEENGDAIGGFAKQSA